MIRIIVRFDNAGMAANVGGAVATEYKTFDVSLPDVEKYIREGSGTYSHAQIVGAEIVEAKGEAV